MYLPVAINMVLSFIVGKWVHTGDRMKIAAYNMHLVILAYKPGLPST